jgi:hypothetical protein
MRNLLYLSVAALLGIIIVAPASAFEFDSTGGSTPGTSANYADPYGAIDSQLEGKADESEAPSGTKMLNSLQLSVSGGGRTSSSVSGGAMGWTNPQPGRLTR